MAKFDEKVAGEVFQLLESDLMLLGTLMFPYRRPVSDAETRAASVILRRWLLDRDLDALFGVDAGSIKVPVFDNSFVVEEIKNKPDIVFFLTGGIRFQGVPLRGVYESTLPFNGDPRLKIETLKSELISLKSFRNQMRIYFRGTWFTCFDIVEFIANKAGGAHLDYNRSKFDAAERAYRYCSFGGNPEDTFLRPQDALHFDVEPDSTTSLTMFHVEIIAAAASFVQLQIYGRPLMKIDVRRSWFRRLMTAMGLRRPPRLGVLEMRPPSEGEKRS